jgi:hypothetical protein
MDNLRAFLDGVHVVITSPQLYVLVGAYAFSIYFLYILGCRGSV